ncbi:HMG-Y-related protein A-like [Musa acuminata AAA Group]|uniref:HMG-Y-related protein A-like n=1 Tax=Musa acuminata AAA Group TaxID=214697 RepID=UPI0031E3E971
MATDEEASKTYPEMIMEAIEALNEKNGSNKSAISKYIETKYGELPPSHSSLLTAHLARMRENGELLFIKNNYFRPGADVPPKRGRGRPPKPKPELPTGAVLPQPRPRGRPPKPKDPLAAAVAKATAGLPRRRGRPPKAARSGASGTAAPAAAAAGSGVKRGRGRPPKVKPALVTDVV